MGQHRVKRVMVVQVCEECGTEFPIWRRRNRLKGPEHVKHMYCTTCGKVTAHRQKEEA